MISWCSGFHIEFLVRVDDVSVLLKNKSCLGGSGGMLL